MKKCFKCGDEKPLAEFYAHPGMADGHLGKCKACSKADVRNNYSARREQYQAYDKERAQLPHRVAARTQYQKDHPEICNTHKECWAKNNPHKKKASQSVSNAVRDGHLVKQPCEVCGTTENIEAHHEDYSRPLEVKWLCKKHHWQADEARRAREREAVCA